jgi:hypothetical protein
MTRWLGAAGALCSIAAWGQGAPGPTPTSSDTAGAIVGRVCRDLNGDGVCGDDEPGIAGARVVMETGQQALTDAQGRYHLSAVDARAPSDVRGTRLNDGPAALSGHLTPGRHRLRLDVSRLSPMSRVEIPAVTLEVPMAGLVIQDFAVTERQRTTVGEAAGGQAAAPSGRVDELRQVKFTLTGVVAPGERVRVGTVEARVAGDGTFRAADVPLRPGRNELTLTATSPEGRVRILGQRVDVVEREGSLLVVPRPPRPIAAAQSPAAEGHPAASGPSTVVFQADPGTVVHGPSGDLTVPASGKVTVAVTLQSGANALPFTVQRPGAPLERVEISVDAAWQPFVVGLLDLEGSWTVGSGFSLWGRGAIHAEVPLGAWRLTGELELRDEDLADVQAAGVAALAGLHEPDRLDRALDPTRFPSQWGDDSVGVVPNVGESRLRLDLTNERWGQLGLGTHRAELADGEVGRYQRDVFGPYLDLHTPEGPLQVGLRAFAAPEWVDPVIGFAAVPAHEEFWATGGSVYYLANPFVIQGSEVVRVEIRDGISGVPVAEQHLVRGRDYEVNAEVGRIILAKPLSFIAGASVLGSEPLTSSPQPVLVVEYEHQQAGAPDRPLGGGEVTAKLGPVALSAGGVDEGQGPSAYNLYRTKGSALLGPLSVEAEYAHSSGLAIQPGDFGVSDDGGLSFVHPVEPASVNGGYAWGIRVKGPGWGEGGFIDASYRARSAEYSDSAHEDAVAFHAASLRAGQSFGHFYLGVVADDVSGADSRNPFSGATLSSRTVGASVGYRTDTWELRLEGRNAELTAAPDPYDAPALLATGGRTMAGLFGRYRLLPWLALTASHDQLLERHGSGPGAYDSTFSAVGAEVSPKDDATIGVRGGWGPVLGPQIWVDSQMKDGPETHYGTYSVDVDGPDVGQQKMVSGARTEIGDHSSVFVEDVAAHDATTVRLSRAVGLSEELAPGFDVSARYERGVHELFDLVSPLQRDTTGGTASFVRKKLRLFARGEYRFERGTTWLGSSAEVHRIQWLASAGASVELLQNLRASGSLNASQTTNFGALEARFVDANAGLSWRSGPLAVILHYGLLRNLPPPGSVTSLLGEYVLNYVSLQPAIHVSRFTLSAGANAGLLSEAGTSSSILSASLRPSVRVVGSLELAGEVARRTSAPDGGQLGAVRAEVGYRMREQFLLALGFNALGYSGLGMDPTVQHPDRIYLRGEMAY